jgi:hypothetical protein
LSLHQYMHLMSMSILKDKDKFRPRTCHEGLERERTVTFNFGTPCGWVVLSTLQLVYFHLKQLFLLQSDWHAVWEQFWELISQIKFPLLEAQELLWLWISGQGKIVVWALSVARYLKQKLYTAIWTYIWTFMALFAK